MRDYSRVDRRLLPTSDDATLRRGLVRPERSRTTKQTDSNTVSRRKTTHHLPSGTTKLRHDLARKPTTVKDGIEMTPWVIISRVLTFYCQPFILKRCGKKDPQIQQAFREKVALCKIIVLIMAFVGFLTFGMERTLCGTPAPRYGLTNAPLDTDFVAIHGVAYQFDASFRHPGLNVSILNGIRKDVSALFPFSPGSACLKFVSKPSSPCTVPSLWPQNGVPQNAYDSCHPPSVYEKIRKRKVLWEVTYSLDQINNSAAMQSKKTVIYNGMILDLTRYNASNFLGNETYRIVMANLGRDITYIMSTRGLKQQGACLQDMYGVAFLDVSSTGCFITGIILIISLLIIGGVVAIRLIIALFFGLFIGRRLGDHDNRVLKAIQSNTHSDLKEVTIDNREKRMKSRFSQNLELRQKRSFDSRSVDSRLEISPTFDRRSSQPDISFMDPRNPYIDPASEILLTDPNLLHTLVMVPCYSEGIESMKATLDSCVKTDYPATHKCILVVADGIIQGSGNDKPTYEYVIDMMEIDHRFKKEDPAFGGVPPAYSYVAIADGNKRKNFARVYAGWYRPSDSAGASLLSEDVDRDILSRNYTVKQRKNGRVPIILVVKVGNEQERVAGASKPGNRGKRDSQLILMNFLTKVQFDDRMTELEFDLFFKLWTITGVHPERYEAVMCIDADTRVYTDSLRHMITAMVKDPNVIGLCGETRVGNPWDSWVTWIQVFEYFISHHLSKAFESVFGVVTCLPGCFSMYRVRVPKGPGLCVPILANPDIVEAYSENVVDTLHKKNLFLLGEDRFLSTMLLKSFPKRKMIYVPNAICETVIPDEFKVLLSQRRRWINSTIHNLLELLLVRDLCGIFCFSMQFVVFMELLGTVVLPAAIVFTFYVIASIATVKEASYLPLLLLICILGVPGLLTVSISGKFQYIFWMLIYLLALPIWNFVLPVYAFWHFDDFSWGETRKTLEDNKDEDHGKKHGEFDGTGINMRTWGEWMDEWKSKSERERMLGAPSSSNTLAEDEARSARYESLLSEISPAELVNRYRV